MNAATNIGWYEFRVGGETRSATPAADMPDPEPGARRSAREYGRPVDVYACRWPAGNGPAESELVATVNP